MLVRLLVLSLCFVSASGYMLRASKPEPVLARQSLASLPMKIGSWQGRQRADFNEKTLKVLGVEDYLTRYYIGPGQNMVDLYIGFYRSQRQGDTMHSPLNCLPGAGWNPVEKKYVVVPVDSGDASKPRSIEINSIMIQKGVDRQVVLYWYQSHGRVVASEYWGKIFTVLDAIRFNRTDAAMVRVISPVSSMDEQAVVSAEEQGIEFVRALYPLLGRFLPQ